MTKKIDISHKTVFFITAFLGLLWVLYQIKDVIVLLFIALIFMSSLVPVVNYLKRFKVPPALSIAVAYIIILGVIAGLVSLMITPVVEQTRSLALNLPDTIEQLLPPGTLDKTIFQDQITNISKNALTVTLVIFNNILAFISIAVLTFYLLLERQEIYKFTSHFFVGKEERVKSVFFKIESKLGSWLRGQIVLSLIIGSLSYVVLFILGVPYALPLAVIAGLLEVVPVIGPIISAIPAVLIAYTVSPIIALWVGLAFFIIQQLENHLIVPQVMNKAVGLNPLMVILAVSIGGKLLGVAGALLAVPLTVVIQIIIEDVINGGKELEEKAPAEI